MANDAIIATLALGGLCLLMWWLARLARKRMGVGAGTVTGEGLRVVGKRPLDQKSALWVVEIAGGRHILLGSSVEGGIAKLDDISPEEFAAMTADEERPTRPRLRIAGSKASKDAGEQGAADAEASSGDADAATEADAEEQKFASVGESFSHFLGKAKDARAARKDRRASGE